MEENTMLHANVRLYNLQSSGYKNELEIFKVKYENLFNIENKKSLDLIEVKTNHATEKAQNEWLNEKFKVWDNEKDKEMSQLASDYNKKMKIITTEIAHLWMMFEDNLGMLISKDDTINDMKNNIKKNQDYIKQLEDNATKTNDS